MNKICPLTCHDSNHNGDDNMLHGADLGCGNPNCWKHRPGNSSKPNPIRPDSRCLCPIGTFRGEEGYKQ